MKTILSRLLPGFLATLGLIALGFFCMARAQNKTETTAPRDERAEQSAGSEQRSAYNPQPANAERVLVCGSCGAQLRAPQVVMVAAPVNGDGRGYRQAVAPRPAAYATDAYYPEPAAAQVVYVERQASPYSYAPAYYGAGFVNQAPCPDPFGEIRVNPIPFYPANQRAHFAQRAPRHIHGHN